MKYFHNIIFTEFMKPEEDAHALTQSFLSLFPFDLEKEKVKLETSISEGFEGKKITILKLVITKDRLIKEFLSTLCDQLSDEDLHALRTQHNRLDEHLDFFLRLDKSSLSEGIWKLTDEGSCVHVKFSVAAFPKKMDAALEIPPLAFRKTL